MTEIAEPDPTITSRSNFIHLISAVSVFISFIFSHLDFSVFIFLCSSLLKILSFLSPLLLTSLIALLSISICRIQFTCYFPSIQRVCASPSDESREEFRIEESEMYRFVFEELFLVSSEVHLHCTVSSQNEKLNEDLGEKSAVDEIPDEGNPRKVVLDCSDSSSDEKLIDDVKKKSAIVAEAREEFESKKVLSVDLIYNTTAMDKPDANPRKTPYLHCRISEENFAVDKHEAFKDGENTDREVEDESTSSKSFAASDFKEESAAGRSDAMINQVNDENKLDLQQNCQIRSISSESRHSNRRRSFNLSPSSPYIGLSASMRREKEWKRTLAGKLFEERQNSCAGGGIDGMDLLWETYEMKESNTQEEQEDDDEDGQLCCLQALKLSTGKMNLGMGRSNIMRISKALRGIGWMHHLSKMRNNKG